MANGAQTSFDLTQTNSKQVQTYPFRKTDARASFA